MRYIKFEKYEFRTGDRQFQPYGITYNKDQSCIYVFNRDYLVLDEVVVTKKDIKKAYKSASKKSVKFGLNLILNNAVHGHGDFCPIPRKKWDDFREGWTTVFLFCDYDAPRWDPKSFDYNKQYYYKDHGK